MSILRIARMGHPVLRERADPVDDPTAPAIHRLITDMIETLVDLDAAGLAAPQVHVPLRVVVFEIPDERAARMKDQGGVPLSIMINPEIEVLAPDQAKDWEACLSLPGLAGRVPRFTSIRYRFLTPTGEAVTREAEGYHARVVQHECDHLDGVLYPMRMDDMAELGFVEEINKAAQRAHADTAELVEDD